MSDNNYSRGSLNAVSYLSYYFVGALVSTLGIVLGPLCAAFNKDPSFIGQVFTLMNIGMFVPIMLGGLLMKKWGLQKTAGHRRRAHPRREHRAVYAPDPDPVQRGGRPDGGLRRDLHDYRQLSGGTH